MTSARRALVLVMWSVGLLAAGIVLLATTGPVLDAVARTAGPDTVVAAVAAVVAWLVLGWLALGLTLTLGELAATAWTRPSRLAGDSTPSGGRHLAALVETLALGALRDAVRSSLRVGAVGLVGGTVAVAAVSPTSAWAAATAGGVSTVRATADVRPPDRVPPQHWPSLDRPAERVTETKAEPPPTDTTRKAPKPTAATYRVRPGDSLWSIAAAHLPEGAGDGEVASAWPRWWSANRGVIGSDPGLIRPGQRLVDPGIRS